MTCEVGNVQKKIVPQKDLVPEVSSLPHQVRFPLVLGCAGVVMHAGDVYLFLPVAVLIIYYQRKCYFIAKL